VKALENLFLVVNPKSGTGKIKTELFKVCEIFTRAGYRVTVHVTTKRGDATETVRGLSGDYGTIVVCGGDGTLNEVITGLMQSKVDCSLGYIPSGTLNEWSSGLNIPRVIPQAAHGIVDGKETLLDIGKFGEKYFSYTASFGAFTSASYTAPQDIKNVLGQAAYVFEGVKSLGSIKPVHLKFIADDREIEGDFLFGAVSNSMSVGGIVKFDETVVKLNDGLFEVLLIRNPDSILKLQPLIDGILRKELDREGMEFFHTKKLTVIGSQDVSWTLDGEYAEGAEQIEIENINEAIKFITPV
jgi:YegS/Rv2252/BmrU family lipid kinase